MPGKCSRNKQAGTDGPGQTVRLENASERAKCPRGGIDRITERERQEWPLPVMGVGTVADPRSAASAIHKAVSPTTTWATGLGVVIEFCSHLFE